MISALRRLDDRHILIYADRHILNEYTSPQAFGALRMVNRPAWRPERSLGVVDHVNPTTVARTDPNDAEAAAQVEYFRGNCRDFGIELFDIRDPLRPKEIAYSFVEADVEVLASDQRAGFVRPGASPEDVRRVVDMILAAQRPAFFVSHGVTLAEAGPEQTRVAELLDIPVITSPNGMGSVPMPHRLALGFIGRNGTYSADQAGRHCDLLIAV